MARSRRLIFCLSFLCLLSTALAYASFLVDCEEAAGESMLTPCGEVVAPAMGTLDSGTIGCGGAPSDCGGGGGGRPQV